MSFIIQFIGSSKSLMNKVEKAVKDNGGNFIGDETKGKIIISTLLGEIQGEYKIDGNEITVEVLKKPFVLSEYRIKKEIEKLIE